MAKSFKERILEKMSNFKKRNRDIADKMENPEKNQHAELLKTSTDFGNNNKPNIGEEVLGKPARAAIGELQQGHIMNAVKAAKEQLLNRKNRPPSWADIADKAGIKNESAKEAIDTFYTAMTPGPKMAGVMGGINNVGAKNLASAISKPNYGSVTKKFDKQPIGSVKNLASQGVPESKTIILGRPGGTQVIKNTTNLGATDITNRSQAEKMIELARKNRLKGK